MSRDWKRPIIFEGTELPSAAIAIDHLGMYGNLPGISEETSSWLWQFTVCVGRQRTDDSTVITRHASEALRLAEQFRDSLNTSVPKHFSGPFEPTIIDEWMDALRTIIKIASERNQCTWEAPLLPDDPNYGRPLAEVQAEMFEKMQKAVNRAQKKPWWKRLFSI